MRVNSVYILIISEAGKGSKGSGIVQGKYEEQKEKRTKGGARGTAAFRVYMFYQRSGKLLPKEETVKDL